MDITYCSIILGIMLCIAHAVTKGLRQRTFDSHTLPVLFLSSFGLLTGGSLIQVGLSGETKNLPIYWRQYVAVGGIVAIGMAVQFLINAFRNAWPKPAEEFAEKPAPADSQGAIKDNSTTTTN